jgi:hypothetical protein
MIEENEEDEKKLIIELAKMLSKLDYSEAEDKEENVKCICGNIVLKNANYCDKCGRKLQKEKPKVIIKKINIF